MMTGLIIKGAPNFIIAIKQFAGSLLLFLAALALYAFTYKLWGSFEKSWRKKILAVFTGITAAIFMRDALIILPITFNNVLSLMPRSWN
jgi:hypothetical protein